MARETLRYVVNAILTGTSYCRQRALSMLVGEWGLNTCGYTLQQANDDLIVSFMCGTVTAEYDIETKPLSMEKHA
jgi:hypothetical protein